MIKLTPQDYCDAADVLNCSTSAIRAVATVESGGRSGFDDQGRLLLRFEGHQFRKHTGGKFDRSHPHLSYSYAKRHGKPHHYSAFNEALTLDQNATMLATSFGMFQPMGFNHDEMGFDSVGEMVSAFQKSEKEHLLAFVRLIKRWGLADELQRATLRDFAVVAKRYNGADYKSNRYDTKMWDYFLAYEKKPIRCAKEVTPANVGEAIDNIKLEPEQPAISPANGDTAEQQVAPVQGKPGLIESLDGYGEKFSKVDGVVSKVSGSSWIVTILTKIGGFGLLLWSLIKDNPFESALAVILIVVAIWYLTRSKDRSINAQLSTPL